MFRKGHNLARKLTNTILIILEEMPSNYKNPWIVHYVFKENRSKTNTKAIYIKNPQVFPNKYSH